MGPEIVRPSLPGDLTHVALRAHRAEGLISEVLRQPSPIHFWPRGSPPEAAKNKLNLSGSPSSYRLNLNRALVSSCRESESGRSPTDPIPDLTTSGPVPGAPGSGLGIPGRTPFWEPLWARIRPKPQVGSQWDADPGRVRTGLTRKCSGPWALKFPYQTGPRPGRDRPPTVSTWDFFVP